MEFASLSSVLWCYVIAFNVLVVISSPVATSTRMDSKHIQVRDGRERERERERERGREREHSRVLLLLGRSCTLLAPGTSYLIGLTSPFPFLPFFPSFPFLSPPLLLKHSAPLLRSSLATVAPLRPNALAHPKNTPNTLDLYN